MSKYDDILAQEQGSEPSPAPTGNKYDQLLAGPLGKRYAQEDAVLNAFATAHKTNPDEYARLRKTAIDAGMTPEQVDMFPEEAARRSKYDQAVRLAQDAPLLSKWMTVEDNARKSAKRNSMTTSATPATNESTTGRAGQPPAKSPG